MNGHAYGQTYVFVIFKPQQKSPRKIRELLPNNVSGKNNIISGMCVEEKEKAGSELLLRKVTS